MENVYLDVKTMEAVTDRVQQDRGGQYGTGLLDTTSDPVLQGHSLSPTCEGSTSPGTAPYWMWPPVPSGHYRDSSSLHRRRNLIRAVSRPARQCRLDRAYVPPPAECFAGEENRPTISS